MKQSGRSYGTHYHSNEFKGNIPGDCHKLYMQTCPSPVKQCSNVFKEKSFKSICSVWPLLVIGLFAGYAILGWVPSVTRLVFVEYLLLAADVEVAC
jgi:hypothetical protein